MNTKVIIAVAAIAVVVIAGVAVYMFYGNGGDEPSEHQYTDLYDNEFTVKGTVKTTVVESGAALRFLSYMGDGALSTIVGSNYAITDHNTGSTSYSYAKLPTNYKVLSKVDSANAEKIIELKPDIVLIGCSKSKLSDDQALLISTLKAASIPTCVVKYVDDVTTEEFSKQVKLMGDIFGAKKRATELLNGIEKITDDLSGKIASMSGKKNVYVGGVAFQGTKGFLWSNVAYGGLLYLDPAKIVNIAKILVPAATYQAECSFEMIYEFEKTNTIDLAILDVAGYAMTAEDYANNAASYEAVNAIAEGDFYYVLPQTSSGTLHDNTLIAAYSVGKILDPEGFASVDLVQKAKEIYTLFLGSSAAGNAAYNGISSYVKGVTGSDDLFGEVGFA